MNPSYLKQSLESSAFNLKRGACVINSIKSGLEVGLEKLMKIKLNEVTSFTDRRDDLIRHYFKEGMIEKGEREGSNVIIDKNYGDFRRTHYLRSISRPNHIANGIGPS